MKKALLSIFGLLPKRPQGHPPFAFRDLEGKEYYAWSDFQQMPPARANEVDDVLLQVDAGISRTNLSAIADGITDAIQEAMQGKDNKAKGRALAKANLLANELKVRPARIIPEECYFALAAICAVRKDEDPYKFDPTIQAEKMAAFRLAGRAGHDFFTRTGAFARLAEVLHTSESGLVSLLPVWTREEARIRQVLAI